jgi:hypothetical protein
MTGLQTFLLAPAAGTQVKADARLSGARPMRVLSRTIRASDGGGCCLAFSAACLPFLDFDRSVAVLEADVRDHVPAPRLPAVTLWGFAC